MRVQAAPKEHFQWIVAKTGCAPTSEARAIEVVDAAGLIKGMVLYDFWTCNSVQAHMAAESPIAWRSLLGPAFEYPFIHAGKGIILGLIPAQNERSMVLAKRFGFTEAHRIRDGWARGRDLVLFEMRKENCRWLKSQSKAA